MAAMSDYLETRLLDHTLRNTSFTSPTTVYMALFTDATTDSGGGTEVSGNAYARQSITFGAATTPSGQIINSGAVTFPIATPSGWGTVTNFGIYDTTTAGNMLIHGSLTSSQTVAAGNQLNFAVGSIIITFA